MEAVVEVVDHLSSAGEHHLPLEVVLVIDQEYEEVVELLMLVGEEEGEEEYMALKNVVEE